VPRAPLRTPHGMAACTQPAWLGPHRVRVARAERAPAQSRLRHARVRVFDMQRPQTAWLLSGIAERAIPKPCIQGRTGLAIANPERRLPAALHALEFRARACRAPGRGLARDDDPKSRGRMPSPHLHAAASNTCNARGDPPFDPTFRRPHSRVLPAAAGCRRVHPRVPCGGSFAAPPFCSRHACACVRVPLWPRACAQPSQLALRRSDGAPLQTPPCNAWLSRARRCISACRPSADGAQGGGDTS
jgi:hypothetical protein